MNNDLIKTPDYKPKKKVTAEGYLILDEQGDWVKVQFANIITFAGKEEQAYEISYAQYEVLKNSLTDPPKFIVLPNGNLIATTQIKRVELKQRRLLKVYDQEAGVYNLVKETDLK